MKGFVIAVFLLASAICVLSASAETLTIPAVNENGVWSSPLAEGVLYQLTVSGRYIFDGVHWADAEWTQPGIIDPNGQVEYWSPFGFGESNDILDLVIDNTSVSWMGTKDGIDWSPHTSSPNSMYRYFLQGKGTPVKFHIADKTPFDVDATGDNSGFLTLSIIPVPEPSSILTLLCGIGTLGGLVLRRSRLSRGLYYTRDSPYVV